MFRVLKFPCVLFLAFAFHHHSSAQDAHLSQFYSSELTLNPALTGRFEGEHRGYLNYRAQWKSMMKKTPYESTILAYDRPYKRFGLGGYLMNTSEGSSNLNFLNVAVSGSYEVSIDPRREHHLLMGLQLGFINKRYEPTTFDAQYDTSYYGYNPALPSGEAFDQFNFTLPEVGFGVYYYNKKQGSKIRPYGGIAAFHLTRPKESFYGENNRLPIRYVATGGSKFEIDRYYSVDANLLYMRQTNNNEIQLGALLFYNVHGADASFFGGPYYRNGDALIFHIGGTYDEYVIRFSYDINTSSLNSVSRGRGAFELSVTYVKQRERYLPSIY